MSLLDTTGKTYTPVSWLPGVRRTEHVRPQTTLREDTITIALGLWTLISLFWDGIVHNNEVGIDSFFTAAHIAMYAGLIGLGVWIGMVMVRYQDDMSAVDISLIPRGYGLAIVALPLAAIAGPVDFTWHSVYGFENQIDSAYSPPHQGLFLSGALLAAIPVASAWHRSGRAPSLRTLLPAVFSVTAVSAVMLFVIHQLVPFYAGVATTSAFQKDIAGRVDAYAPGAHAHHIEGLARAITHYGDQAFPYYFYTAHHTVGGIMLFTAVVMGALLYMRRRWVLPVGTATIMFTSLGLLFAMLSEYREAGLIPSLVIAGIAADVLLLRLVGPAPRPPLWKLRLFAGLVPPILWGFFFLCVALFEGGLGWHATIWVGVMGSSAGVGVAASLLVFPPVSVADEESPDAALDRAPAPPLA